jgi:hypothetical protein
MGCNSSLTIRTQRFFVDSLDRLSISVLLASDVKPEEACNQDYDDHDADDVKNVHCALRFVANFSVKTPTQKQTS